MNRLEASDPGEQAEITESEERDASSRLEYQTPRMVALSAHDAGLCVVPPREDGSKAPLGEWKRYQHERPQREQVAAWYRGDSRSGVGIVCGAVSGGLELFEFDDAATFFEFQARAVESGLADLVARIKGGYLEQTPKSGYHTFYRCSEVGGNSKLASRPKRPEEMQHPRDKVQVLIESRGEGGYAIIAPSHGPVHPSGKPYVLISGGVESIVTITANERAELWALARTFDQLPRPVYEQPSSLANSDVGDRPGDIFNARASWAEVLEPHGWQLAFQRGGVSYWRRPGKGLGISASTNWGDSDLLYVFSTSTTLDDQRGYSKFSVYALLEHGGDFAAAAKALHDRGFRSTAERIDRASQFEPPMAAPEPEWAARQELPSRPPVPELPEDMLPAPLRPWLADIAVRACIPLEFVAMPAVCALSAVVGRSLGLHPERFDDWLVVPNLWGAIVGPPGWLKSYAYVQGMKPINRLAKTALDAHHADINVALAQQARLEAEIAALKATMQSLAKGSAEGKASATSIDSVQAQLAAKLGALEAAKPREKRYVAQDPTVAKLGELLQANPRGLAVVRDELAGWIKSLDREENAGDRAFYLESWNGNGAPYAVDRIVRGTVILPPLCLAIFGGIQPGKLEAYVADSVGGGAEADGFLQRFQLLVYPDSLGDWKKPETWPDGAAKDLAYDIFEKLDRMRVAPAPHDDDVPALRFSPEAQQLFDAWRSRLGGWCRMGGAGAKASKSSGC